MDPLIISFVLATFLFAALLKGTAGLGFSTTCLGIMAMYLDLTVAIPLVILPSLTSNILVMVEAGRFRAVTRRFWLLYAAAFPGLLIGLWVLGSGDGTLPRAVLGGSMFLYGIWGLWGGTLSVVQTRGNVLGVGIVTGFVNGLTGSQIMPIMPYLMSLDITKDELVQAINTSFTIGSLVMLVGMGRMGHLSVESLLLSAVGIIPVGLGIRYGGRIRRCLPEATFRKVVFALLGLLGLALIVRAFL